MQKKFLELVEIYNHKLFRPNYYRVWERLNFSNNDRIRSFFVPLRLVVRMFSYLPFPGRNDRILMTRNYYESHELVEKKVQASCQHLMLLYGFSRSGTSYLQNHISVYFAESSMVLQDGKMWNYIARLKHTQEFFERVIHECNDCIKVVIPLRSAFDALTSWCVYDPEMLNQNKINEALNWYASMLDFIELNNDSSSIIPVSFEAINTMSPLKLAKEISLISKCKLSSHDNIDYLRVFTMTNLGDSTGYSSAQSIATPLKSHVPNQLKNKISSLIAIELKKIIDNEIITSLENRRVKILNNIGSVDVQQPS